MRASALLLVWTAFPTLPAGVSITDVLANASALVLFVKDLLTGFAVTVVLFALLATTLGGAVFAFLPRGESGWVFPAFAAAFATGLTGFATLAGLTTFAGLVTFTTLIGLIAALVKGFAAGFLTAFAGSFFFAVTGLEAGTFPFVFNDLTAVVILAGLAFTALFGAGFVADFANLAGFFDCPGEADFAFSCAFFVGLLGVFAIVQLSPAVSKFVSLLVSFFRGAITA